MKNIFKIFRRDMKNIFTNWVAVVVVIALMVIPSLYSLINIEASWDPYGNTSGIKVAIINEDKGTVFKEKDINLGDELVEKLKDNDKIGWTFVDKEKAKNGLLMEEYYATIEIPEDFSKSVTTLVEKNVQKPKLIYTVNEKINAIAPKMTDSAVKTVKGQLDENITKTVSGIIFRLCDEVGINVENNRPELRRIMDATYELDENMPELEAELDAAIDGTISIPEFLEEVNSLIPTVNDIVDTTDYFLRNSQKTLDDTQNDLSDMVPIIKDDLVYSENLLDVCSVELGNLDENILPEVAKKSLLIVSDSAKAMKTTNNQIRNELNNIKKFINKVSKMKINKPDFDESIEGSEESKKIKAEYNKQVEELESIQKQLKDVNKTIGNIIGRLDTIEERLDIVIDRVDEEIAKLDNGEKLDIQTLTDIRKIIDDLHTLVSETIDVFESELVPFIESSFDSITDIYDNSLTLLEQTRDTLPNVENLLNTFIDVSNKSKEELLKLKEDFPDIKNQVHKLSEKFKEIDDKEDVDELLELITNDWNSQSDFMANPIEIEDNRLFPWPNYGSTATPFYTMLCLWIGGYMLSILIDTEVKPLDDVTEVKPYEAYFGKLLLFLFIGVFQAVIASCGALFLLKVYTIHPVMFVFYTVFVSIVFMVIIYTAVSLWGHGGIVFGIVLLVMQVAGTSGNFPIEVNPRVYQVLYPMLPFTYAISGIRQIMAGIVYSILIKDIIILTIYMIASIIIGLSFKKMSNKWIKSFVVKLKESKLMAG